MDEDTNPDESHIDPLHEETKQDVSGSYEWNKFKPSLLLKVFNPALQLVLLASLGSFMFGFNIALLNTATKNINSSFLQCGVTSAISVKCAGYSLTKHPSIREQTLAQFPECKDLCPMGVCPDAYDRDLGALLPAQCMDQQHCQNEDCKTDPLLGRACRIRCGKTDKNEWVVDRDADGNPQKINTDDPKATSAEPKVERVQCPGGYNDVGCPSLKWYNAFLTCAILIGATVGALTGGRFLAYGRRTVLVATMGIFMFGIIGSTVSNSFSSLIWARLIVGLAVGFVSVASPTYMSEVTPPKLRGSYGVMHQLMIVIGIFIPLLLGLPLADPAVENDYWAPSVFQEFWWRFMLALGLIPTILALYLLLAVYTFETPFYYVEKRQLGDAAGALRLIYGKENVQVELNNVINTVREGEESKAGGMTFGKAFQNAEYRHVIIVGCLLSAFQQLGGINVFMTSSSDIFKKAGLEGIWQTVFSIIMGFLNVVMTLPTLYLIERMGRKSLMLVGSVGQTAAVLPAAIAYWIDPNAFYTQVLATVAVIGFVTFFAVSYGPVLWVYLFEIYPIEIKDTAVNWVCAVIMVFVANVITNQISYSIFAFLELTGTVLIATLMKETKGLPLGESPFVTKKVK